MKKNYLLLLYLMLSGIFAYGQEAKPKPLLSNSVSLQLGSNGLGVGLAHQLKPSGLNVRISVDYFDVKSFVKNPIKVNLGDGASDINIDPQVSSLLIGAKIDWHPFKKAGFKIVGGLSYGTGDFMVDVSPVQKTGRFKLTKDVELDAEDFGTALLIVKANNIRPYAGIGFGRAIPKSKLGFSFDLGTYYSGSPKLSVPRTGTIESILTDQNITDIEKNVKGYSFLPNLTFSIIYKITK